MDKQRSIQSRPTLKDTRRLGFYAALFNVEALVYDFRQGSKTRSDYTEVIRPGAFTEALSTPGEVIANVDHDPGKTFAKRSDGSLILQQDPVGLFVSCWLPDDSIGNAVLNDVQAGKLDGASFKFRDEKERWQGDTCEVLSLALADVCLTASPAYEATRGEVHLRTKNNLRELFARMRLVKIQSRIINIPQGEK